MLNIEYIHSEHLNINSEMWGCRNKIKSATEVLSDTSSQENATRFLTSSFYGGASNINNTRAIIPLVDLANENVTVTEFDNSVD